MDAEAIAAALARLFDALAALQHAEIERAGHLAERVGRLVRAAEALRSGGGRPR